MSKPFTLKPLLDLSKNRLDDATRDLGKLVAQENESAKKLEILRNYRAEYEERFRDALNHGIGVEALRNYSAFMARIDDAIDVQKAQVNQSQQNTSAGKQAWMQQRNKLKAFDTLHDRHRASENRKLAKSEQSQQDEHSARRHRDGQENDDH